MLIKKLKTCLNILNTKGISGLLNTIEAKLDRSYQPDASQIVFQLLNGADQPGLMLDVGAHHGSSLALFADHHWQVIAFEPNSHNRAILSEAFGAYKNVSIDPCACSDQAQSKATLYASSESTGVSGLSAFLDSHTASEVVAVTTLADALAAYGLTSKPIDYLKIDTEGFDLMVLKGYPWDIAPHPKVILCEFEDNKSVSLGYDFYEMADFLINLDYRLIISEWHPVKAYGRHHRWRRFTHYPCQLIDENGWGNIYAVKDEQTFNQLQRLSNRLETNTFS